MKDLVALESLAAELTHAVYSVALEHERPASWIDLELDLWRAVRETLRGRMAQGAVAIEATSGPL